MNFRSFFFRANKRSIVGYFDTGNVHHDAIAFFFDFVANLSLTQQCLRWWHKPIVLTWYGVNTHQKYCNQVAFLITHFALEQLSNVWILSVHKTTGIFLQECSALRQRRETSCMSILRLKHWENKGFVRQLSLFEGELSKNPRCWSSRLFLDSVWCKRKGAMSEPEVRFTKRWNDYLRESAKRVCWWTPDSVRVPHISWQDKVKEKMDKPRLQIPILIEFSSWRCWTKFQIFQRNRQGGKSAILARREKKCRFLRELQARMLHVHWSRFGTLRKWSRWSKREVGWTGTTSYGRISCAKAHNLERI